MGPYAAVVAVVLLAGTVQGASGFGFSLVAVPLLAVAAGPKDAVVLASVLAVVSTAGLAVRFRDQVDRPLALRLLAGACVGLPFGAVWDMLCEKAGVPVGTAWIAEMEKYEAKVLGKRA